MSASLLRESCAPRRTCLGMTRRRCMRHVSRDVGGGANLMGSAGVRRQRARRSAYRTSSGETDGSLWERREHHPHREHERVAHQPRELNPFPRIRLHQAYQWPQDMNWVSYNSSKSAVLQMGRSMACELGPRRIRVNTLSPGHIYTS